MSLTRADDTPNLPAIKPSEGELFRTVPELAWTADGEKHPLERHLELLADGACWVAETDGGSVVGFPSAEVSGDALNIWELADLLNYQNGASGARSWPRRSVLRTRIAYGRLRFPPFAAPSGKSQSTDGWVLKRCNDPIAIGGFPKFFIASLPLACLASAAAPCVCGSAQRVQHDQHP